LVSIPELVTQLSVALKGAEKGAEKVAAAAAAAEAEETRIFLESERSAAASEELADLSPDTSPETVRRNLTCDYDDSADEKSQDVQSEAVAEDTDTAIVRADAEEYARRIQYDSNNPATPVRKARHDRWESPLAPAAHSVVMSPDRVDDELIQPELAASITRAYAASV
jgi:hypothetical protein